MRFLAATVLWAISLVIGFVVMEAITAHSDETVSVTAIRSCEEFFDVLEHNPIDMVHSMAEVNADNADWLSDKLSAIHPEWTAEVAAKFRTCMTDHNNILRLFEYVSDDCRGVLRESNPDIVDPEQDFLTFTHIATVHNSDLAMYCAGQALPDGEVIE